MNEIEIVQFQIQATTSSLQSNIIKYYDVLNELNRMSLFLLNETVFNQSDIEKWFEKEDFGICEDGFWQSLTALGQYRDGTIPEEAISYSCHPDLRFEPDPCFQMYCHRNVGIYLRDIKQRLPGSAWIYYQAACNIALQYPFIDQAKAIPPDFDWSTYHTWVSVSPENNPERTIQWTAPSIDYAGEGLILSVSKPVYLDNEFTGLWSIDLPMKALFNRYVFEKHIPEQQNFIADYQGNIIAHPIIETKIDFEKGSIFQEKIESIGPGLGKINLSHLISQKTGQLEMILDNHRPYNIFYKIIPEINWIYFSMFPKDRLIDVVNTKVRQALETVGTGDYSYRMRNVPEHVSNNILVKSFNEMAEAIEAQHQQLQESQKRLAHSEKLSAIGTLAGGIAHDFNNILSSVIGFTQLCLDGVEKGSIIEDNLQEVYAAGIRAKELVRQIATFARQSEEESKPIRLDLIVQEVVKLMRASIPSTIEIQVDIKSRSFIIGDPINVHQILMNLCTNASHAMPGGGILSISLKDQVVDENNSPSSHLPFGPYIRLRVEDNGVGIPGNIIDAIFEPYFTTKSVGKGTGMGLAMVHGIVKKYKGEIFVDSKVGSGTRFSIFLPVTGKKEEKPLYENKFLPKGTEHILFVDDDPAIASMGHQMLTKLGYRITASTSSLEAFELINQRKDQFDMVITDMTMPHMSGDRLAVELLKIKPGLPIVLCTGYSDYISDEIISKIGIKAFAFKPIVQEEMAKIIRNVFDQVKK